MEASLKQLTSFFHDIGAAGLQHTGDKSYLAHVARVHADLKDWGCDEDVCSAGLFHSIYGTQRFQRFTLPLERRGEVRALIGERAERLAYWNCVMDRHSFDEAVARDTVPHCFVDRLTGQKIEPSERDFTDLMTLHLCDWLEQVERANQWDYRRDAYRRIAERLGGVALEAYERVYAAEPISR